MKTENMEFNEERDLLATMNRESTVDSRLMPSGLLTDMSDDYYKSIALETELRPIVVSEGVVHHSLGGRLLWWVGTAIKMTSLLVFSLRTDRLFQCDYMKRHWKHYTGMVALTTIGVVINMYRPITLENHICYIICAVGLLYYPLSMTVFAWFIGPRMRALYGKALTLRLWEYFLTVAWQIQVIGFSALLYAKTNAGVSYLDGLSPTVAKVIGYILVAVGLLSKVGAVYMTGYNTYYWYDMVLDIPNAHFVENGIYKYCGSPTYTLGRLMGFGAALSIKLIPMFIASIAEMILINLFNYFVEQPFVKRMYGGD